ncbi:developmental regulator medusa [Mucor ambiguus]|uniref:Developmental regulator medusa n=1 Tax=Mucor ambiguus TaxID=91626 RepID=A0A0C9MNF0_9FUNG|nr:developmental regulator medusa [Mucor ambiguus]
MDTSNLSDIPAVRLASGVEMQQRWPSSVHSNDQQQPFHQQQQQHQQHQKHTTGEAPRLIELAPTRGNQGTVVTVVVQSLPHQIVPVKLAFNSLVVDTKQMQAQGITSLVAAVPPFQHTHSNTANVPISICMLDKDSVTETWPVAEFIYDFDTKDNSTTSTSTPTTSASSINTVNDYSNDKMPSDVPSYQQQNQQQPQQPREENFLGGSSTPSNYDSFYQQPVSTYNQYSNYYNAPRDVYNDSKYNQYRPSIQARPNQQAMNPLNYNSNPMNLFGSNTTGFTGMLTGFDQNEPVVPAPLPQTPLGYPQQVAAAATPQRQSAPTTPSAYGYGKSSVHVPSTSVANYQPYPGLVSRANLKIMGDLDSMAKNWAADEWEHRRRLVQFWREQNGNEIRCTFDPVAQGERITANSGHIVVSCIYWAERNDCFITSVDCIHLLESLMDIRFSVEEKNRVRRNLEGFRPLTVSKCKAESADFFKLIMGFPNPKPRNIEKDVKVFPWKTLPYALKKIVTKYTASSYNSNNSSSASAPHQRRAQLKSANATPTATPPVSTSNPNATSYMNVHQQESGMTSFYSNPQSNIYQQPPQTSSPFAYPPSQQQEQQEPIPSMYQSSPSSVPAFTTSSYTQSSPVIDSKNTPSPRMQYPYNDMLNSNSSAADDLAGMSAKVTPSSSSNQGSPSLDRRSSLDNQQDYLVNFKNE